MSAARETVDDVIRRRRPCAPFSWAIAALRDGRRVTRLAWADPDRWLRVAMACDGDRTRTPTWPTRATIEHLRDGHLEPWAPTHADLLATDWTPAGDETFVRSGDVWMLHSGALCVIECPLATEVASVAAHVCAPVRLLTPWVIEPQTIEARALIHARLIAENVAVPKTEREVVSLWNMVPFFVGGEPLAWTGGPIPGDVLLRGQC